jgi:hypothetical protein
MNKAQIWGITLDGIPRQADGRRQEKTWSRAIQYALCAAKEVHAECPDSGDTSVTLIFDDNSKLYIGNPAQQVFAGFTVYE